MTKEGKKNSALKWEIFWIVLKKVFW